MARWQGYLACNAIILLSVLVELNYRLIEMKTTPRFGHDLSLGLAGQFII